MTIQALHILPKWKSCDVIYGEKKKKWDFTSTTHGARNNSNIFATLYPLVKNQKLSNFLKYSLFFFLRISVFKLDFPPQRPTIHSDAPHPVQLQSSLCPPHPQSAPQASTHPATVPPCVCTHPAPILQHGCWENTSGHLCHVIVHHNAKFFQVRVRAPNHAVTFDLGEEEQGNWRSPYREKTNASSSS